MAEHYDLNEIPWTDVAAAIKAGNDLIMIPVGSMEKHGHHVPLGVDSYTTMGSSVELAGQEGQGPPHAPSSPSAFPRTTWAKRAGAQAP